MHKIKFILLCLSPVLLYVIPNLPWIPEIERSRWEILYPVLLALVILANGVVIYRSWKNFSSVKKKVLVVTLSVIVTVLHSYIFLIIDFRATFSFISKEIEFKKDIQNRRIYILKKYGMFNSFFGSEIVYRKGFSPFYSIYYKTDRHLEPVSENSGEWVLREYYYTLGAVDTTDHRLFRKRHRIKNHYRTIKIESDDLE